MHPDGVGVQERPAARLSSACSIKQLGSHKNVGEFCEVCSSCLSRSRNGAKLRDEELILDRNFVASQENIVEMSHH